VIEKAEVTEELLEGASEDAKDLEAELVPSCKHVSERYRERKDVLSCGNNGDDVVDDMCGSLGSSS
jgi:hypothetical protein